MIKFLKILCINLLILSSLLLGTEFVIWKIESGKLKEKYPDQTTKFHSGINQNLLSPEFFPNEELNYGRNPEGLNNTKKPIVLFGCSYTYGYKLTREDTFSYKLSEFTKRPVYNQAFVGWGAQHMLYQTELDSFYEKIPEPEYVIYTFIDDHIRRAYLLSFCSANYLNETLNLRYKEENNKLVEVQNKNPIIRFIRRLYLTNKINQFVVKQYTTQEENQEKCYDFVFKHILQSRENMEKRWKNTKYIVLIYNTEKLNETRYLKQKLKKSNFIVIDTRRITKENLFKDEYKIQDNHPSGKAWDLLTPLIVEKLENK